MKQEFRVVPKKYFRPLDSGSGDRNHLQPSGAQIRRSAPPSAKRRSTRWSAPPSAGGISPSGSRFV
ncbi:hypothetical protein KPSA3_03941 [Pseudomonas syringae pv. actinidiae]|uniref:Uncharacterized protein n=1 Tax=Pseudomonas syringae pv. actinidiae TaxID=103796 RepID=A0AAN4Q5M5_PSESF|nr:hypothetical protein KPSA3_03941 [Pseudomonas syringae pv. actinidiae]